MITLNDILSSIDHIVICEDVYKRPYISSCNTELDEDELSAEQLLITTSDEELTALPLITIHSFTNLELLGKIAKLDVDLLSNKQRDIVTDAIKDSVELDLKSISKVLAMIHNCNSVSCENAFWISKEFPKDSKGSVCKDDCIRLLHSLKIEDYIQLSDSFNLDHIGNDILIFRSKLENVEIHIKLDIDKEDGACIAIASFHKYTEGDLKYA